ncbi:MAG TPA: response regulator transcription factor, partial [Roseiflexaceae bacterium]|nr:response regulator transcription factor [Roseiflexaceae bacterium]
EQQYAVRAVRAGASGYLTKESAPEMLVAAIRRIAGGGAFISPETAERLVLDTSSGASAPHTALSDREFEVFRKIVAGQSVSEIAAALSLSVKTISTHKTHILEKMGMASQAELVRYAVAHGLVDDT